MNDWSPESWKSKPNNQPFRYDDPVAFGEAVERLRHMPPLVTSWEIERLRQLLAEAQEGKRFLLQGGDCAETLADCTPSVITNKLKILLQMSLVLVQAFQGPVIRVGRVAGQYAKPRSKPTETRDGVELPNFFGDSINAPEFTPRARRPDPQRMLQAHQHAAATLNFIRSLTAAGFADAHHTEYWDLPFRMNVPRAVHDEYHAITRRLSEALRFMSALGEQSIAELTRVDIYTSHEALHLDYECTQATSVPRREGHYLLSTHFPWIGERTRQIDGSHVEFLRGVRNPIAIKVGPSAAPEEIVRLVEKLNPTNEPGRITLVTRLGATRVGELLPPLVEAVRNAGERVLWVTDPMHGNTRFTPSGRKTRHFDDIIQEINASFDAHERSGSQLGGVHFEMTGDDVTECTGGVSGVADSDKGDQYLTTCDPRLNYGQSLEMSFLVARRLAKRTRVSTVPPSSVF
ncbi:MAG TPA: 3-deoxy-7-phosphoheptulonate synthase class II [Gemmatimonadaceae bacterium]|nr:3-deoxy-7-phosphoheptulonate synthase class II [Gemmatimonadaceae bacterium]